MAPHLLFKNVKGGFMDTTLNKNMSKSLITILETEALESAYAVMQKNTIRHLPVVNEEGEVVGILSERDLERAMISEVSGEGSFRNESCQFDPDNIVRDYMSWPVKTVHKDAPLKSVAQKMIKEKVSSYLVTDNSKVLGILTTEDMLKVLVGLLNESESDLKLSIENILLNPNVGRFAQTMSDVGI